MITDTLGVSVMRFIIIYLALGPHPQRELTLTPRLGFACPRLSVAAGAIILLLTLIPRLGFTCPRLGMAAGALSADRSRAASAGCRRAGCRAHARARSVDVRKRRTAASS